MAEMTLAEKIGQLNLLASGEGLTTGAAQATREVASTPPPSQAKCATRYPMRYR